MERFFTLLAMDAKLIVDLNHFTIQDASTQERIISRELARALALLAEKKVVTFAEFLMDVFQFRFYESHLHRQKVYNCLQRVKKILPQDLKIITRYEKIYLEGNASKIFVIKAVEGAEPEKEIPGRLKRAVNLVEKLRGLKLKRRDFENQMGVSKSEAHRLLTDLENLGLVTKEGRGPATRYIVSDQNHSNDSEPIC